MKVHGKHSSAFNYISSKYVFRFNVVSGEYEFSKKKNKLKWHKYDDRIRNQILMLLLSQQFDPPVGKVDAFIEREQTAPEYNPFKDYFENLGEWNGKTDYIQKLAETVPVENPQHFRKTLEKYLIGVIDCLLKQDSVNDVCLVFQSGQGTGKSRWMRSLLPKQFRKEYLYEGAVDTRNKDHTMYLSQYWFIHLDELESLRNNEIGALKSYITRQRISLRAAYGRYKTTFVRRASFLGSVNDGKFLSDTTGNRRWLVFKVIGDIDYQHKIDPDKLWGQVFDLWVKGTRHWFVTEEIKEINNYNERFRVISLEEELLKRFFRITKKKGEGQYLSSSEIIEKIVANTPQFNNKLQVGRMGKALHKHATKRKWKHGIQKYYLEYLGIEHETNTPSPDANSGRRTIKDGDDVPF